MYCRAVPDPVTSRGNVTAKRSAAASPRRGAPPLKTKAEKRAEAKAAKARARAQRKRRELLTIGGAAVVVLALVVGLIVWIGHSSSDSGSGSAGTASAAASDAAAPPSAAAEPAATFPPLPVGADPALGKKPKVTKGAGKLTALKTTTLIKGTGAPVQAGQTISVNYVGVTYADGKEFDESWKRQEPFSFPAGGGQVIKGWDQGLIGVPVGSRVQLDIPPALAYGEKPAGGQPAGALRFVVDVLSAA
ncbi:FK506-binding protein [Actinoplanes sp. SE50/110]|nr:FK506-binding protein [Actinoplanes sp. SE50/110]